jgi:hypothetical protein
MNMTYGLDSLWVVTLRLSGSAPYGARSESIPPVDRLSAASTSRARAPDSQSATDRRGSRIRAETWCTESTRRR